MPHVGASTEDMETLASRFSVEAGTVRDLVANITSQLDNTWWVGPAADRFRSSWEGDFQPALSRLQDALDEASRDVATHGQNIGTAGGV